jgi:predicted RNase H-related nuclease YkuK (DUF458 family)
MEQSKIDFYKENPDEFIKDFFPNLNLHNYQIELLKTLIKNPDIQYYIRVGRGNQKRAMTDVIGTIYKELK